MGAVRARLLGVAMSGDFSSGSDDWPGLSKLIEEAGEVVQVCGKLINLVDSGGVRRHWDGSDLVWRLEEELGDLLAAVEFVIEKSCLSSEHVGARSQLKLDMFRKWHAKRGGDDG